MISISQRKLSDAVLAAVVVILVAFALFKHRTSYPMSLVTGQIAISKMRRMLASTENQSAIALLATPLDCPDALAIVDSLNVIARSGEARVAGFIILEDDDDYQLTEIAKMNGIKFPLHAISRMEANSVLNLRGILRTPAVLKLATSNK